ncbi:DNA-binding response regulator [Brucella endophytica]|uniref:Flagellar transcriptional regulator FtcR n=1 Tax=Brucella endophytica TaxID=1963359 RepID=A0A916WBL5_9HYPH|nr:response regulator transcription factor [Brucella endophytica]GGA83273.1 DNA-binding response regulator [Brucella endophytica]
MTKVLLIDDDEELTSLLIEYLSEEGFVGRAANDPRHGIEEALSGRYDIIVLDVMMPRINGIDVLQRIRASSDIPVLMLSARGENVDRITGLNLGADDYVPKPCFPDEIVARLRAILRRLKKSERGGAPGVLRAGALEVYPGSRTVICDGRPLELTGTEFNLLEVLVREAGQLVAKSDLSKRAFGSTLAPFDRRIDVHISSIRQKLGLRPDGQPWIRTVRAQGYQLVQDPS